MIKPSSRRTATIISPLRYPGAKRRLAEYIAETLRLNDLRPKLFVEPFAGGASVALRLLHAGVVDKIALGERDPLVAGFWKTVFDDSEWLIQQIGQIEITLEKWDYYRQNSFRSNRDRAMACLFLNRTSFSGILAPGAGPIGGRRQESEYKIDCRFNREQLSERIQMAAKLRSRVLFVANKDWKETISKVKKLKYKPNEVFYYFDPPFYAKAENLYRYFFDDASHHKLHDTLSRMKSPWLLSYDPAETIIKLYSHNGFGPKHIDHLYSAASGGQQKTQEIIITNLANLPKETRTWKAKEEWNAINAKQT